MLAKNVNDNADCLAWHSALRFFASKLAPTMERATSYASSGFTAAELRQIICAVPPTQESTNHEQKAI